MDKEINKKTVKNILDREGLVKVICKVGGSTGIIFNKQEVEKFNFRVGNTINLDDAFVVEDIAKDSPDNKFGLTKEA